MRPRDDQPRRVVHIGPDHDPTDTRSDGEERPSFLIEDERTRVEAEQGRKRENNALARRLVGAFVAVVLLAVVFHLVMPAFKLRLPPVVPVLCYLAIAAGAILSARDANTPA